MKVLVFDLKESERRFFENNKFNDFEFKFYWENIDKNTKFTDEQLNETDVISICDTSVLTEEILQKFRNLRVVATRSSAYNHIDINYCMKSRIAVTNLEAYGDDAVAQYLLGLIIAIERKIKPAICGLMKKSSKFCEYEGRLLNDLKLGIIGCGYVGLKLAKIVKSFNMKVLVSSYKESSQFQDIYSTVSFDELLSSSDVIVFHPSFGDDSCLLLGEKEFEKMKDGVVIVSSSDTGRICLKSLYKNLLNGKVRGVGLDVLYKDIKSHKELFRKMLKFDNVIVTPHLAFNTEGYTDYVLNTTINNIRNYYKGMNSNRIC